MAERITPTFLLHNTIGDLREDYIEVTTGTTAPWDFPTRLGWIEHVEFLNLGGGDQNPTIRPNGGDATIDDPNLGGIVNFEGIAPGLLCRFRVVGR